MAADRQALRQQILAQIDRCAELAYGAGHHFAQHGKHAPSSVMAKADADAKLISLVEDYAAAGGWCTNCGCGNDKAGYAHAPLCAAGVMGTQGDKP
jgi:hypothetical protein